MWQFRDLRFADNVFLRFADLRFAESIIFCCLKTSANPEIHNFLLTNLRTCDSRIGSPPIFEDLRSRYKPKNLRICDLRNNKKHLRGHLLVIHFSCIQLCTSTCYTTCIFAICGFTICGSILFSGLKTSANRQIHNFLLTNLRICDLRTGSPQILEDL
jgi:hypothetical protein